MKRILSIILASVMLFGMLGLNVAAGDVDIEISNGMYREDIVGIEWGETSPFCDINSDKWYYGSVKEITSLGVMKGVSADMFEPDEKLTRGMLVTILARYQMLVSDLGLGGNSYDSEPFSDVKNTDWYGKYVTWAHKSGYVKGYPDGTFRPNDPVTREDAVTMIFRYAKFLGAYPLSEDKLSSFTDVGKVSDYAYYSLEIFYRAGILNGKSSSRIAPKAYITRAEASKIILSLHNTVRKSAQDFELTPDLADVSYKISKTELARGEQVTIETSITHKVSYYYWGSEHGKYLKARVYRIFEDGSGAYYGNEMTKPGEISTHVTDLIVAKGTTYTAAYTYDKLDGKGFYDMYLHYELGMIEFEDVIRVK
ncbi:MAG: S-layer homology domain-containing protein [Clostridia bacterium]|nr:S-layer homology domain-containing protein [Clostridia bacterium]